MATAVMAGIVSISLLVGGIGIMNIMLVTVTERTREIGVRLAIGARRSEVRWQFLIEAAILSGTGGLLGVTLAAVIGEIGLWVGAGCLGLTLFKKRKAMFDRLFRRKAAPAQV